MKSKKGFTLIELLAIIVILAIIAVITVPIILNIIEDSQKGAAKDSAYGFKDSLNKFYVSELAKDPHFHLEDGTYTVSEVNGSAVLTGTDNYTISLSGTVPTSGTITIENNDIVGGNVQIGDYCIDLSNMEVTKGSCEDTTIANATPDRCFEYEQRREIIVKDVEECASALMTTNYYNGYEEDAIAECNGETRYDFENLEYGIEYVYENEGIDLITEYPNVFEVNELNEIEITGYTCGGQVTEYDDWNIISYTNGEYMDVVIPNKIDGKTVTSIGMAAFSPFDIMTREMQLDKKTIINSVTIPNSVTTISFGAFSVNQLSSVIIPNSITEIPESAFEYNQLASITIPNSVKSIGELAFDSNQLTNLIIPNSVINIGSGAFNDNKLPDNQAFIYARNDDGTEDITTIVSYGGLNKNPTISNSVTTIGNSAFSNNQLTSVTIPNSVTSIGNYAFDSNQFTYIVLGSNVEEIGYFAFYKGNWYNDDSVISGTSNSNLTTIYNNTGRSFNWGDITWASQHSEFETGIIINEELGNINVVTGYPE